MWGEQKGLCPICLKSLTNERGNLHRHDKAVIDHCHTTGNIRGILCTMCNKGIGLLKDDINYLERAINHIRGEIH